MSSSQRKGLDWRVVAVIMVIVVVLIVMVGMSFSIGK